MNKKFMIAATLITGSVFFSNEYAAGQTNICKTRVKTMFALLDKDQNKKISQKEFINEAHKNFDLLTKDKKLQKSLKVNLTSFQKNLLICLRSLWKNLIKIQMV